MTYLDPSFRIDAMPVDPAAQPASFQQLQELADRAMELSWMLAPPAPPAPAEPLAQRPPISVDDLTDEYMDLYDKDGDGSVDLRMGQSFETDERITGGVGNVHTMLPFFQEADANGDQRLTRDELMTAISRFDALGENPLHTNGDGMLNAVEREAFLQRAIGQYSRGADSWDDRGVAQTNTVNGRSERNRAFDQYLPEYVPLD